MNLRKTFQTITPEKMILPGLILLGLVLRLRLYLLGRSLWLDEAMLALNIVGRTYTGLLQPLDYHQGGPVAFLLAEKLVITLLGNRELALRLIPFLAGCASLVLFALLLRQVTGIIGTYVALALFAIGIPLTYYASEVKQYSSDVFITLLLLWLAGGAVHPDGQPGSRPGRRNLLLAIIGALSLWFSHPVLFVLAGIGATLFLQYALQKDTRRVVQIAGVIGVWLVSLVILYFASLRGLAADQFLHNYWAAAFMPRPPWANPGWFSDTLIGTIATPLGLGTFWILPALLILIGLIALARNRRPFAGLLGLTLAATLAASELGLYPFAGRMILFVAPILLVLVGAGLETVPGWFQDPRWLPRGLHTAWLGGAVTLILAGFLFYQPLTLGAQNFIDPNLGEHIRPSMAFLQANYRPGDKIYVYYWALPAFRYYAPRYGFSTGDFTSGHNYGTRSQAMVNEINKLKSTNARVWILFSHVYEKGDFNVMDRVLAGLDKIGNRKREFIEPGTSVYLYLYDLTLY